MRIRKRPALSSLSTAAFSDLQLAPPPSDHTMVSRSRRDPPENEVQNEQKEFGDERLRVEAKNSGNNDMIRKIVHICDGGERFLTSLQPSSSSSSVQDIYYEVIPLKKRKGRFERTPNEEANQTKMKSKTNKKCNINVLQIDHQKLVREENGKKSKRGSVIMEGSRCSRVNGRGWRCGQPTLVGYSLCEHHLGKGRLRSVASTVRHGAAGGGEEEEAAAMVVTKKRTKVGVVKARSMSSLLSQFDA